MPEKKASAALYNWRKAARAQDRLMPDGNTGPVKLRGIRQVRRSAGNSLDEKDEKNNEGAVSRRDIV